jgi:anti-sigma B factor antagonist
VPIVGTIIQLPLDGKRRLTLTTQAATESGGVPRFAVTRKINADSTMMLVRVTGEVDLRTAPVLAEVLELARKDTGARADLEEVVVDLRGVVFLSAAGLDVLSRASIRCARDEIDFRVAADQPVVTRPLEITSLDQPLRLCSQPEHRQPTGTQES